MARKSRRQNRRVIPIANMVTGRLHRFENEWVLVILEHEGRDIRAIFRRDEVEMAGDGAAEIVGIKDFVQRKVDVPTLEGVKKVQKWVLVKPADAVWIKNRHQTPVVMSKAMKAKILQMTSDSILELTRP